MATAMKKAPAVREATTVSEPGAIKFQVFEDNGGGYRWTILGGGDVSLAQSETFATYEDAEQAADVVRDGAGSAGFDRQPAADRPAVTR